MRLMFEENSGLDKQPALTSRLRRTPFIKSGWTGPKITGTHREAEIARGKVPKKKALSQRHFPKPWVIAVTSVLYCRSYGRLVRPGFNQERSSEGVAIP